MNASEIERTRTIYKVTLVGTFINIILSLGKFIAGVVGKSGAMIADSIHSLSDFVTDLIVLLFVRLSSRPSDEDHKYGHGKFETLAGVVISIILIIVGIGLGYENILVIKDALLGSTLPSPKPIALIAAIVSILSKEGLFWYTIKAGKRINSSALMANGWHHRSDAFSSIASLIGIGGAMILGGKFSILDPLAALLVSLLIIKVGYDLLKPGLDELLEKSLPVEMENEILGIINNYDSISDPHNFKTRRIGSAIAIESHVRIDGNTSVNESHALVSKLEEELREKYGKNTLTVIHIEPTKNRCSKDI